MTEEEFRHKAAELTREACNRPVVIIFGVPSGVAVIGNCHTHLRAEKGKVLNHFMEGLITYVRQPPQKEGIDQN